MNQLPNFVIIGAAKSGTSSLWAYLNQHPEIFLSRNKEPNYFALAGKSLPEPGPAAPERLHELLYSYTITELREYLELFRPAAGAKAIGEASVRYLYTPGTAARLHVALPNARLIVMLRDPVKRLYSHYCMNRQFGLEPLALMAAVESEAARAAAGWGYDWHYVGVSSYSGQLCEYLKYFSRDQLGIFQFEEFAKNPVRVLQEICRFLEVDSDFTPDVSLRMKGAYRPRSFTLDGWANPPGRDGIKRREERLGFLPTKMKKRLIGGVNLLNRAPVKTLAKHEQVELRRLLADEIAATRDLLGINPRW
jgi:hypothetical protein